MTRPAASAFGARALAAAAAVAAAASSVSTAALGAQLVGEPVVGGGASTTPVSKVLELLRLLEKQLVEDGQSDEAQHTSYTKWYNNERSETERVLGETQDKIESLKSSIDLGEAFREGKTADMEKIAGEQAAAEKELSEASFRRQNERKSFEAAEAELATAADQFERALEVLAKKAPAGGASLLDSGLSADASASSASTGSAASASPSHPVGFLAVAKRLRSALVQDQEFGLTEGQHELLDDLVRLAAEKGADEETSPAAVLDFVQVAAKRRASNQGVAAEAGDYGDYDSQSGSVSQTLQTVLDKTQGHLDEARKAESTARDIFKKLKEGLDAEIKNKAQTVADLKMEISRSKEEGGQLQSQLLAAQQLEKVTVEQLTQLKADFSTKDKAFNARKTQRTDEALAVDNALRILESDEAKRVIALEQEASDSDAPASFLQVRSKSRRTQPSSAGVLRAALARKASSLSAAEEGGVSLLATSAKRHRLRHRSAASEDPFAKVKSMVRSMLRKLSEAQAQDQKHAAWCDSELTKSIKSKEERETDVQKLKDRSSEMQADLAQLNDDITNLNKDLSEMINATNEATQIRMTESSKSKTSLAQYHDAQKLIRSAIAVLKKFYDQQGSAASFLQLDEESDRQEPTIHDNSLVAYWDQARCGIMGAQGWDDYHADWCGGLTHDPQCKEKVEVDKSVCASGKAKLSYLSGGSGSDRKITMSGCEYLYFAAYECEVETSDPNIKVPADHSLTAYWDQSQCGLMGPRGEDDFHSEWCGGLTHDPQCKEKVEVVKDTCESGLAKLTYVSDGNVVIDGCEYLYFATYECEAKEKSAEEIAGESIKMPSNKALTAYWDQGQCGLMGVHGEDDFHSNWCGGLTHSPDCWQQVQVVPEVCPSGLASLTFVSDGKVVIDGCEYLYFATYECDETTTSTPPAPAPSSDKIKNSQTNEETTTSTPPAPAPSSNKNSQTDEEAAGAKITIPGNKALTAYWDQGNCGLMGVHGEDDFHSDWCGGLTHSPDCKQKVEVVTDVCPSGLASLTFVSDGKIVIDGCEYLYFATYACDEGSSSNSGSSGSSGSPGGGGGGGAGGSGGSGSGGSGGAGGSGGGSGGSGGGGGAGGSGGGGGGAGGSGGGGAGGSGGYSSGGSGGGGGGSGSGSGGGGGSGGYGSGGSGGGGGSGSGGGGGYGSGGGGGGGGYGDDVDGADFDGSNSGSSQAGDGDSAAAADGGFQANGMGSGVIGMLEVAESDYKKLEDDLRLAETTAQKDFNDLMSESEVREAVFKKDLEYKSRAKVKLEGDLIRAGNDLKSYEKELEAVISYLEQLKSSCTIKGDSYDERQSRRESQLASLREALGYLNNQNS